MVKIVEKHYAMINYKTATNNSGHSCNTSYFYLGTITVLHTHTPLSVVFRASLCVDNLMFQSVWNRTNRCVSVPWGSTSCLNAPKCSIPTERLKNAAV